MINFIDEKGIKHSAIVECKKTKGVNGEKSLSGTVYTNDEILEGIGRGWRLEFENEKYCLTYVYPIDEGNRIVVEFDAVHEFFFDLNKKVVYSELNGSNTAKAYLDLIFNGSGYSYLIEVNIPAFEKEGFGMRNRLDLFKEFISDTGVEFSVNGKVVRILEKVGSNLSTIVKKGFNLNELRIEKDPGSFITYKKGFGAWVDDDDHSKGRLEVEYLSPLASIYGKLEGDPIVDERYKVASNFETRLKNEVESSYGISVDIDMEDLTKAGYEYEQPHEGDYIMAINKDLGFEQKIRIMSYETSYDTNGNIIDHKVSCGSDNIIRKSIKEDDDFRKEIQAGLEGAISTSNKAWVSANGKTTVFEGPDEPTATAIGDMWFQIDGEEKIMRIWNGYEWKPVFNPGEIEKKVEQAEQEVQTAIDQSNTAINNASQAIADAGFAKNQSATALTQAGQAVADANSAITDAQSALDAYSNMSYENRNLLIGSNRRNWANASNVIGESGSWRGWFAKVEPSTTYSLSRTDLSNSRFRLYWLEEEPYVGMSLSGLEQNYDTELMVEGIVSGATTKYVFIYLSNNGDFNNNIKLEKGSTATPWSPAPEDVQVQITNINGELSRKVSQQTFDTLQGTVNTQSTQINQNKADIQARATKTEVNTLTGTVNSLDSRLGIEAGKISALNSKTDGHTTEIWSLQSSFSGLNSTVAEVQSDLSKKVTDLQYRTSSTSGSDSGKWTKFASSTIFVRYHDAGAGFDIVSSGTGDGETYTGEIYIRHKQQDVMGGSVLVTISLLNSSRPDRLSKDDIAAVVTINDGIKVTIDYYIRVRLSYASYNITPFNKIGDGQLHYHATQPYIAELPQGLELNPIRAKEQGTLGITTTQQIKFATFEQTVNGFMTAVQNEKADRSEVTQLAGQWSATVAKVDGHTGQITNLGEQINLRLTKAQVAAEILKDNQVLDTRNTNEPPSWYYTNYPKQTVRELKTISAIGLTVAGGNYATVTTDVSWSDSSGGNVEQTAKADNGVYQRRGNGASWSAWAKVADTSNILSQINLSTEGVLIQGKNIWLDGNTKINDAVIKTAHIADLAVSGAKIANASISSAKIISLDASKITANTLSAITSNTGALNVSGWLTTTTENYGFRGTYNYGDELYGAYNPRWFDGDYRLSHRYLTFQANVYDVNSNNTRGAFKYYGETFYGADYLKLRQYTSSTNKTIRARVDVTADSIIIGPNFNGSQSIILNSNATSFFAKDASFADGITVNSQNQDGVRTGRINAPMNYNTLILNNNRNLGTLELGYDTSRYLRAKDVYDRTYSLASNMIVTNEGTLGRATSARKYKANIVELKEIYSKAKDVLQIQPVTWLDKRALIEVGTEQRGYGFIADEFHELGLTEVVQYGADGQVEGLAYDRISMYLLEILKDHEQQLASVNSQLSTVTQQLTTVANSRLQHSLLLESKLLSLEETVVQLKQEIEQLRTA